MVALPYLSVKLNLLCRLVVRANFTLSCLSSFALAPVMSRRHTEVEYVFFFFACIKLFPPEANTEAAYGLCRPLRFDKCALICLH